MVDFVLWCWKNVNFWICFSIRFCHIFKNLKVTQIFWNFLKSTNIVNWINNKHSNNQNSNNKSKVIVNTHQVQNQITFFKFCRDWREELSEFIHFIFRQINEWNWMNYPQTAVILHDMLLTWCLCGDKVKLLDKTWQFFLIFNYFILTFQVFSSKQIMSPWEWMLFETDQ